MENNFIQMATSAGHAVAYMIGPIFKLIIAAVYQQVTHIWNYEITNKYHWHKRVI